MSTDGPIHTKSVEIMKIVLDLVGVVADDLKAHQVPRSGRSIAGQGHTFGARTNGAFPGLLLLLNVFHRLAWGKAVPPRPWPRRPS